MGAKSKAAKTLVRGFEDLQKLFEKEKSGIKSVLTSSQHVNRTPAGQEVQEVVNIPQGYMDPSSIRNQARQYADSKVKYYLSDAYQNKKPKSWTHPEWSEWTDGVVAITDPNYLNIGHASDQFAWLKVYDDRYNKVGPRLDQLQILATDPLNPVTWEDNYSPVRNKAILYNRDVIENAERRNGSTKPLIDDYAKIRQQALQEAMNGGEYNTMKPDGYQKYFTKRGWDSLKKYLLSTGAAVGTGVAADQYSEEADPVLNHMKQNGRF